MVYKECGGGIFGDREQLARSHGFFVCCGAERAHSGNGASLPPTWLHSKFEVAWHGCRQAAANHVSQSQGTV